MPRQPRKAATINQRLAAHIVARARLTPLEMMVVAAEEDWGTYETMKAMDPPPDSDPADWLAYRTQIRQNAVANAEKAAPYLHPRLTAVAYQERKPKSKVDLSVLTPEQRAQLLKMLRSGLIRSEDDVTMIEGKTED